MTRIILAVFFIGTLSAADNLLIRIDPQQIEQLSETIKRAAQDGDNRAVLVAGRRALELVPNDPELQAPIYLLMSFAARNSGEPNLAGDYAVLASILDPSMESRLQDVGDTARTRGDNAATIQTGINVFGQAFGAYEQIKMMKLCLEMVKHGMAPPPQCSAAPTQIAGQVQPLPGQPFPPQPIPASTFPAQPIPSAPIGQPMPVTQPLPGQPLPVPMSQPLPGQPIMMPTDVNGLPIQTGANVVYPSAPIGSPVYQPPMAPPASVPGWPAPPSQPLPVTNSAQIPNPQSNASGGQRAPRPAGGFGGSGTYPTSGRGYSYAPPAGQAPYANARYSPRGGGARRGGEEPVYKVIHDHANIASQTYFERSCGGLLSISGTNLTVTMSGGEEPRVIPASEILEIRLNSVIGRDAGAFHIATRGGLYLNLAPESQDRDQARSLIEAIRTSLSLSE